MSQTTGGHKEWPDDALADALGEQRFRETSEGIQGILRQADSAPAFTESLIHLPIPLKSEDAAAIGRELYRLLGPEPGGTGTTSRSLLRTDCVSPRQIRSFTAYPA
jgi:hypothetical protein